MDDKKAGELTTLDLDGLVVAIEEQIAISRMRQKINDAAVRDIARASLALGLTNQQFDDFLERV